MNKELALLVSLCIGLVCGFIVPSDIPEFIDEDAAILAENDATQLDEMKMSTIEPGFVLIPNGAALINDNKITSEKIREIDDKALYESSIDKENNLNERSYVYINQKFIPPARKGFQRSKELENTPVKTNISPMTRKETTKKKSLSRNFSYGFFQPSLNEILVKDVNDNYILSKNECEDCAKSKKPHGLNHRKYDNLKTNNKGIDEELSYIELLKPPYVRTINKNNKIKYDYQNMNDFMAALAQNPTHYNEINTFRRLHSIQKPVVGKSGVSPKEDNLIFDDNTDQTYRPLEETAEERREMDRFQKNTYGEQITNEKVNINYNDCNYKDCMQGNKKYQRKVNNPKCKCRVRADAKRNNIQHEILGKGKMKANKNTVIMNLDDRRPSEDSDYDNISFDSASRGVDDELMKTVNKLNYTLQMYH